MNATIVKQLSTHPFSRGMTPAHLNILTENAKTATWNTNDVIFREGQPANQFYIINSGRVALEAHEPGDGTVLVSTLEPGAVLGWSWLFPPFVWHFQARAVVPTELIELDAARLLRTAEADHDFGFELMKRLAQVVIQRLQTTRKQLLQQQIESALEG
ncbi:MAG: cyclic nucleotide-binding domain-containing protein [Verrucomicrobia bacterium]|nr:cyclic nucleotide-binding domain-containing protein [Verrucomicrobiota bacterium]